MMHGKTKRGRRTDEPLVQKVFQRRGTVELLILLKSTGGMRFSEASHGIPNIAPQVIGVRLSELRELKMVARIVLEGPPTATRYELTELGEDLAEVASGLKRVALNPQVPSLN